MSQANHVSRASAATDRSLAWGFTDVAQRVAVLLGCVCVFALCRLHTLCGYIHSLHQAVCVAVLMPGLFVGSRRYIVLLKQWPSATGLVLDPFQQITAVD